MNFNYSSYIVCFVRISLWSDVICTFMQSYGLFFSVMVGGWWACPTLNVELSRSPGAPLILIPILKIFELRTRRRQRGLMQRTVNIMNSVQYIVYGVQNIYWLYIFSIRCHYIIRARIFLIIEMITKGWYVNNKTISTIHYIMRLCI